MSTDEAGHPSKKGAFSSDEQSIATETQIAITNNDQARLMELSRMGAEQLLEAARKEVEEASGTT